MCFFNHFWATVNIFWHTTNQKYQKDSFSRIHGPWAWLDAHKADIAGRIKENGLQ